MSISRAVWRVCYHYCGPLWPNPHIYKASRRTRMMIVIVHPQDTVQCTDLGDCVSCVSLYPALCFSSPLCQHALAQSNATVGFTVSSTDVPAPSSPVCTRRLVTINMPQLSLTFLKRLNCTLPHLHQGEASRCLEQTPQVPIPKFKLGYHGVKIYNFST